jgi:quercetin dioxygenase-like cupin family protein
MRLALLLVLAPLAATAAVAQTPPVEVKPVFSSTSTQAGQPIMLPQGPVQVSFSTYTIAPGAKLPVHRHPYPRYGYVLDGQITVTDTQTGEARTFGKGEVILEMVDRWHFGENRGSTPMQLLVIDQAPAGAPTTVLQQN